MAPAALLRFDIVVLKNKAIDDSSQVPLAGARVDFYGQGATVKLSTIIQNGQTGPVDVYGTGTELKSRGG